MKRCADYYIHRGEWVQPFCGGWCWEKEMCDGSTTGILIYKALSDAKNAINKHLDGTHKAEPRVIGTAGWSNETKEWYKET